MPNLSVFNPAIDRLMHLHYAERVAWLANVRRALDRFPELASYDRTSMIRAIVVGDAVNRILLRIGNRFPKTAVKLGRFVPISGATREFDARRPDRPVIFALMHFGPVHFAVAILKRLIPGRKFYVVHAGGDWGRPLAKFYNEIDTLPILASFSSLSTVGAYLEEDPRGAVLLGFDHLNGRTRYEAPFLGGRLKMSEGLSYLAERYDATVVPCWLEMSFTGLRVCLGPPLVIDWSLPEESRRDRLMDHLVSKLEERVRAAPSQWTEWSNRADAEPPPRKQKAIATSSRVNDNLS